MRMTITALVCALAIPAMAQEWYEGGTLHRATGQQWIAGSHKDQLATSADFIAAALKKFPTRAEARALNACISEAALAARNHKASELAALCVALLGW